MLIVCPSCASEYTIDPAKLGADGRTLRCAICRDTWFVTPDGQPAQRPTADAPRTTAAPAAVSEPPSRNRFSVRNAVAALGLGALLLAAGLRFPAIVHGIEPWSKAAVQSLSGWVDGGRAELEFRAVTSEFI